MRPLPFRRKPRAWRRLVALPAILALASLATLPATAQAPVEAAQPQTSPGEGGDKPQSSALDAPLLYQLLIGELELDTGHPDEAFEVLFDAARRTKDEDLFKRTVQVGLQSRSADQVKAAVAAWRRALPQSLEAIRYQLQVALLLGRVDEAVEPFTSLVERSPAETRAGVVTALPQLVERSPDRLQVAQVFEPALQKVAADPALRMTALVTQAWLWFAAGDIDKALALTAQARDSDPQAKAPVVLAIDLLGRDPRAEKLVLDYLAQPRADPAIRVAYGQALAQQQRHVDALKALNQAVRDQPDNAGAWLTIGAIQLELRQPQDAETALKRYLDLNPADPQAAKPPAAAASKAASRGEGDSDGDDSDDGEADAKSRAAQAAANAANARAQAYLMLAQAAEQRGDLTAAAAWLDKVDVDPSRALDLRLRRATLLAKQGKVEQARALVRSTPETTQQDARNKIIAEAQVLREVKRWQDARDVLAQGVQRFPKDVDLIYEQAMAAEKLGRMDEMESLLQQVIADKPDHQHAYNALGYSLADRGIRLDEARRLVRKALDLAPGDPYITDSLGWVEFRTGNRGEALRLLRQAWAARPDTEIGAHLGEVLWTSGERDEARRIWRESRNRDAANDVLRETLTRLKVDL